MRQAQTRGYDKRKVSGSDSTVSTQQYFTFIVNDQEYGVDILRIQEIKGWTGVRKLPQLPHYIKGVIDLRGVVVPIIDLRERIGLQSIPYNNLTVVVILKIMGEKGEKIMGIAVDSVSDVYDISSTALKPAPDLGDEIDSTYIKNVATVKDKMVMLLDIDELLDKNMPIRAPIRIPEAPGASTKKNDEHNITLIEESFEALSPKADELVSRFYQELFQRYPEVKPMFAKTSIEDQEKKLLSALQLVVSNLRQPENLAHALKGLGAKHQAYGAIAEHYDAVVSVFLDVLEEVAGDLWNNQLHNAWQGALDTIKNSMLDAYDTVLPKSQVKLLETNFKSLSPQAATMVARFYELLFERYPAVKPLFANTSIDNQQRKLLSSLEFVIANLRNPTKLTQTLKNMGQKHQGYGAVADHYDAVASVMIDVLKEFSASEWNSELESAWKAAFKAIKEVMLSGYEDGLSENKINLLETSFQAIAPRANELVSKFYGSLFKRYPDVKPMFANTNPAEQKKKLIAALQLVVNNLRNPERLTSALQDLGHKHQGYGAVAAHYDAVAGIMLEVLEEIAGDLWNPELAEAWQSALLTVKDIMLSGYK